MPKLWSATIDAHRTAVRESILDSTAALAFNHGVTSVTMSQIAEKSGIGRATLYKYFPDVETILLAWHQRQVSAHLAQLTDVRDRGGDAGTRLRAVLETYAFISHAHHVTELAAVLHRGEHMGAAERRLKALLRDLLTEGTQSGEVRSDIPADELATYCLHALAAAGHLPSKAAVHRLVSVTLEGLRPPAGQG